MSEIKSKSNKGLYLLLMLTVLITVWTAYEDSASQTTTVIDLVQPAKANIQEQQYSHSIQASGKLTSNKKTNETIENDSSKTLIPWETLDRAASIENIEDVFKSHSWAIAKPPPPPPPEPEPPPPQAPPAPFQYVGKVENAPNAGKIFLIQNNQFYYVAKGENINKEWRLDKEEANVLRLTYLPLNLPQVLVKSAKRAAPALATEPSIEMNQN